MDFKKGRGAQYNPKNKFDHIDRGTSFPLDDSTEYIATYPKSIVNKVDSPDIRMKYSLNPYQGCEHGCIYCYARNTHPFWGYSAGVDFESKILYKKNAVILLEKLLRSKSWQGETIVLSGNTDCYQPAEKEYEIIRSLLKTFLKYKHPVGIITKNHLILRDLDIISELSKLNLIHVYISLTTLHESLRRKMEPRTSSVANRLKAIALLAAKKVPVYVMMAPVIPSLNDSEIMHTTRIASIMGAGDIRYAILRLNGDVGPIFEDWIHKAFPLKAKRVLEQIKSTHDGKLNESRFGMRMRGQGALADIIAAQFRIAKNKYYPNILEHQLTSDHYLANKNDQLSLF